MENFRVSTSRQELDISLIHRFLAEDSTWARGIPRTTVERTLEHSLCFGGYIDDAQVAFGRVISDYATFANLVDVFVLPEFRGRGYGKSLLKVVMSHPQLQGLRRFTLATADAHVLYGEFGFTSPLRPQSLMERYFPRIYEADVS